MVVLKSRIVYLIYKTLLMDFGISAAQRVFESLPIPSGYALSYRDFYQRLFDNTMEPLPFEFAIQIYNRVESFLANEHISQRHFIDLLLHQRTQAFLIDSRDAILPHIEPFIAEFFGEQDPRITMLRVANVIHQSQLQGSSMELISLAERGTSTIGLVEILYDPSEYRRYAYNPDMWKSFILREVPRIVGAEPFDTVQVIADCRTLDMILGESGFSAEQGIVRVGETVIGKVSTYRAFLESRGEDISLFAGDLSVEGVVVTTEFSHPENDYALLREGCFYGASSYLIEIGFETAYTRHPRPLQHILQNQVDDRSDEKFLAMHESLMDLMTGSFEFVYLQESGKLMFNGKLFNRGAPAHILCYLLQNCSPKLSKQFEYQSILADPFFEGWFDPFRPNIDVRIKRLRLQLSRELPQFEISMAGKGVFIFSTAHDYSLVIK